MRRVLEVARREFRATVLTKAFLVAAVILPAVMWGLAILLPVLLRNTPTPLAGRLALVDPDGRVLTAVAAEFDPERLKAERARKLDEVEALLGPALPGPFRATLEEQLRELREAPVPTVELEAGAAADLDALKARARAGDLIGVAVFEPAVLDVGRDANHFELFVGEGLTRQHSEDLEAALRRGALAARANALGLDLARMQAAMREPACWATTLTRAGKEAADNKLARIFVPLAFMMLLWMSTWMTGNQLLISTIEEKSSRVIEVLLSAVSPMELLAGKILGQCSVGFLVIGLYAAVGGSAASKFGYAHLVPPEKLAYLALYFVMAFFMVASTMAAIGSAVNELREAQTLLGPVTIVFMIPLFAWFFISDNPNSTFAVVVSFIPPMTPFAMILRVTAVESVPLWQILATSVVGFAGVYAMIWAAARIFRVGILMTGKAPTPAELFKWIRYA